MVNSNKNIEFKNFIEIDKTIKNSDGEYFKENFKGVSGEIIEVGIDIELNEDIDGLNSYSLSKNRDFNENIYVHDGHRDINISLTEINSLKLEEISDIRVEGIDNKNYKIYKDENEKIFKIRIPRDEKKIENIKISYKGKLPEVEKPETFTTNTNVNIDNKNIDKKINSDEVLNNHITEYTIRYVDEDGNELIIEPEIFKGEIGTTIKLAIKRYINDKDGNKRVYEVIGNNHQYIIYKYKANLFLSADSKKNEIVYKFKKMI